MKNRSPFMLIMLIFLPVVFVLPGCSTFINNQVANALTGDGSSEVFTGDSDPELVGDALPFAIKMYEALLSSNPGHQGLILTTGSMFVMYANAFVQGPSEFLPRNLFLERQEAAERAKKLYLRGLDILYGGLGRKYRGFDGAFQRGNLPQILAKMKKADVPSLYWAAAAGLSAYGINPLDMDLGVRISEFLALIDRAYELNPGFNYGSLDDFYVIFYSSVPESFILKEQGCVDCRNVDDTKVKIETHFRRALEKSGGKLAGPYVSYAEKVSIPGQDYDTFKIYLDAALAVDIDADPANRLVNVISQRKARYLLDSAANYFIVIPGEEWDYDEDDY